jgi:hypothetical protein
MRPFRFAAVCCALGFLGAGASPLQAAWNNVFQVCCRGCGGAAPAVANYGPVVAYSNPCCDPCPPVCTTRLVQRCYYQPVVSYLTRTYYEAVTSYRTSYYYEPVTTLRYSYYRDPCTGCCQQVATPCTSYRLKAQCCPVTSYLQRCALVPVTTYQQAFYYEPVTTCCRPACCDPCAGTPGVVGTPGVLGTPGVIERSTTPNGSIGTPGLRQYNDTMPPAGTSSRQLPPQTPRLSAPVPPVQTPPAVKLERIVALPPHEVEGLIVRDDRTPHANVRVKLISADQQGAERTVTANAKGEFRATLASGGWLVYVQQADGKLDFVRKIEVREDEPKQFTLVSR